MGGDDPCNRIAIQAWESDVLMHALNGLQPVGYPPLFQYQDCGDNQDIFIVKRVRSQFKKSQDKQQSKSDGLCTHRLQDSKLLIGHEMIS